MLLFLFVINVNWRRSAETEWRTSCLYCTGVFKLPVQMPIPWLDKKMSTMRRETTEGRNPLWRARTKPLQHTHTHIYKHTHTDSDTDNSSSFASLRLCTNKALILHMHSLNSVFTFANKYLNVETSCRLGLIMCRSVEAFIQFYSRYTLSIVVRVEIKRTAATKLRHKHSYSSMQDTHMHTLPCTLMKVLSVLPEGP